MDNNEINAKIDEMFGTRIRYFANLSWQRLVCTNQDGRIDYTWTECNKFTEKVERALDAVIQLGYKFIIDTNDDYYVDVHKTVNHKVHHGMCDLLDNSTQAIATALCVALLAAEGHNNG